ncbi:tyrosine-type recombinase/integrase [Curtobacterium sp. Csp2]|uniref:tyrosine-type recombinase/integrase n=1 Tax=Curtobacterium sp. Csp2 TaxID=2495430 RepID=UPI00157FDA27|nr:tyrosine-type recombinase/integrase [Curtobacterium sp. Csp2]QKS17281.1 tyrosine-type recombinase/integrase [Curtobacterium sp. Csp2]
MARPPLVLGTWGAISRLQQGPGKWTATARFRDFDGVTRKVSRQGPTGRRAEDALVEHLRDRVRTHGSDLTSDSKVSDLAAQWVTVLEKLGRAPSTVQQYKASLEVNVLPALGGVRLREATVPVIDRVVETLSQRRGPGAAKTARVVLNAMFALAVRRGAVAANPVRDAQSVRLERKEVRVVALSEVQRLRKELRAWDGGKDGAGRERTTDLAPVIDMLLGTGMRTGELVALRWTDLTLDVDVPLVTVQATAVQLDGVGLIRQERPKSDSSFRKLQLPDFVWKMLVRRREAAYSDWVFPSSTGTLRSPANLRRQWREFKLANDYPEWITPKSFRKTVATAIRDGRSIEDAGGQLGHSGTDVTRKFYAAREYLAPDVRDVLDQFGDDE